MKKKDFYVLRTDAHIRECVAAASHIVDLRNLIYTTSKSKIDVELSSIVVYKNILTI